jgi:hypothetical protein
VVDGRESGAWKRARGRRGEEESSPQVFFFGNVKALFLERRLFSPFVFLLLSNHLSFSFSFSLVASASKAQGEPRVGDDCGQAASLSRRASPERVSRGIERQRRSEKARKKTEISTALFLPS